MPINKKVIKKPRKIGGNQSKREGRAGTALSESVARRKQLRILSLFGTIDFDPSYDYKSERSEQRSQRFRFLQSAIFCPTKGYYVAGDD